MVTVNLHGRLGEDIGKTWHLNVSSVSEAMRAIEANTRTFRKWLLDNSKTKGYSSYAILINNKPVEIKNQENITEFKNSEVFMEYAEKLQTIDLIPEVMGSRGAIMFVVAAILIVVAVFVPPLAPLLILGALGLIAAGVTSLLYNAQQADPISTSAGEVGGPSSYLFNGPVNTVGEGGPVPVGYGTLLIGSNNVFASYDTQYKTSRRGVTAAGNSITSGSYTYLFNSNCRLMGQKPITNEINF